MLVSLAIDTKKSMILAGGCGGKLFTCKNGDIRQAKILTIPASKTKASDKNSEEIQAKADVITASVV